MKRRTTRVCFVTGSRAEYGLLAPLMHRVRRDRHFALQVIVTGSHLSPEFGSTFREIERDGLPVSAKVEIVLSSDTRKGIGTSMGLGCLGFADAYESLAPDLIVLLGDRYETFIAAAIANVFRIPVAHLHGGEITEGAYDEAFRHSVTKMSHLHFTSTGAYRHRVIQMGEHPSTVFNVGAIGIDNVRGLSLMGRKELEKDLGIPLGRRSLLVTFHPGTASDRTAGAECRELLAALDAVKDTTFLFTKANADNGGRVINTMVEEFVGKDPERRALFASLGQRRYLSLVRQVDAVVGNSSSGIIEAPSLRVPTVNIGERQSGRVKGPSVIDCAVERGAILRAVRKALTPAFLARAAAARNPYGDGRTTERIFAVLRRTDPAKAIKKRFYDLPS